MHTELTVRSDVLIRCGGGGGGSGLRLRTVPTVRSDVIIPSGQCLGLVVTGNIFSYNFPLDDVPSFLPFIFSRFITPGTIARSRYSRGQNNVLFYQVFKSSYQLEC